MLFQYVELDQENQAKPEDGTLYILPADISERGVDHDSNSQKQEQINQCLKKSKRVKVDFSIWMFKVLWCHSATNGLRVRPCSVFPPGLRNVEESGTGRSKRLWSGSRLSSRNMRRLVFARSIPVGSWGGKEGSLPQAGGLLFYHACGILCVLNLSGLSRIPVQSREKAVRTTHRTHNMKISYAEKFSITVQVLSHARAPIPSNFRTAGVMSKSSEPETSVPRSR